MESLPSVCEVYREIVGEKMKIKCVWEHNGDDTLLYAENHVGAFSRGKTLDVGTRFCLQSLVCYTLYRRCCEIKLQPGYVFLFRSRNQNGIFKTC